MPQRSIRFSNDLHAAIEAEAARRGYPHTFSSVLQEAAERGLSGSAVSPGPSDELALEAALSKAGRGSLAAPPPVKGAPDVASASGAVKPAVPLRAPTAQSKQLSAVAMERQRRDNERRERTRKGKAR